MELKRRTFLGVCGAALAAAVGGWAWLRERPPVRWLVAARAGRYPGPLKSLDERDLKKPGRWAG